MSTPPDGAPDTVRIERTFNAPARAVFEAWTSVEVLKRWWRAEQHWETPVVKVDVRVGGVFRVVMRDPADGKRYGGGGEFVEIDAPARLVFTWTWDDRPHEPQLIDVTFAETNGITTVVLVNSGLPDEQTRREHRAGWQTSLDNLERVLAGRRRAAQA